MTINENQHPVRDSDSVIVPAGVKHNVVNTSKSKNLKFYTIYSPTRTYFLIHLLKIGARYRFMGIEVLDDEGFVKNPDLWTDNLSKSMAKTQFDITLTDQQSKIILYIRDYYKKWETLPMLKTIRDEFGLTTSEIDEQFKRGSSTARGVICKLAGLPKMLCIASGC